MGNGVEGLWINAAGANAGLAFIDSAGKYLGFEQTWLLLDGAWTLQGTNWQFDATSKMANTSGGVPLVSGLVGSGTYTAKSLFQGNYGFSSPSQSIANNYANANALAVSASDVAGTWSSSAGLSLTVTSAGALTGRYLNAQAGDCALQGTLTQAGAGTAKNLFTVSFVPSNNGAAACNLRMRTASTYEGFASITFTNTGTQAVPVYVRSITLLAREDVSWLAGELVKQ